MRRLGEILADQFTEMAAELVSKRSAKRAWKRAASPVLTFGKWRGHTVAEMVARDRDYAGWLIRQPNIKEYQPELCREIVSEYMASWRRRSNQLGPEIKLH